MAFELFVIVVVVVFDGGVFDEWDGRSAGTRRREVSAIIGQNEFNLVGNGLDEVGK